MKVYFIFIQTLFIIRNSNDIVFVKVKNDLIQIILKLLISKEEG